jgi:tRNA G18 (ribose-2'-O)-methylase SpoU
VAAARTLPAVPGRPWVTIDDPADPRLDPYRGLRDAEARRAMEAEHGLFVVEGVAVIRRVLQSEYRLRSLLLLPGRARELAADLAGTEAVAYVAERELLVDVAGFDVHRGALAIAERRRPPPLDEVLAGARVLAVLEGLTDHENLGAIARSASALGVDALLLDPTCADPLYRRCVRVSMGEVLFVPWARLAPWPDALEDVRAAGFTLVALTPAPAADELEAVLAATAGRVALLLGSEAAGLSAAALAAADRTARIPIRPGVDSLNVGHAAAIAFDAAARRPSHRPAR